MKTIFKYILSVALGASILTSCDLDTIPTTSVDAGSVFGKTGDAEKVLNGGWNNLWEPFNSYANPGYGAMLRANDAMGSDVVLNDKYGFRSHNQFNAIYGKGGTNTLSWLLCYRVINDGKTTEIALKDKHLHYADSFICILHHAILLPSTKIPMLYAPLSIQNQPMRFLLLKECRHPA